MTPPSIARVPERLEAGVAEIGGFNAGQRSARKKSDGRAAGAGGAAEAVRRTAEIVDQRVVPIAQEFAGHADTRAAGVDSIIEALGNRRSGVRTIVVSAGIQMHAARNRNAVQSVGGTNRRTVVRHFRDRIGRRETLGRMGRVGVRDAHPGLGLRIGFCGGGGIGGRLPLQLVELLFHQAQLLSQRGDLRVVIARGLRMGL